MAKIFLVKWHNKFERMGSVPSTKQPGQSQMSWYVERFKQSFVWSPWNANVARLSVTAICIYQVLCKCLHSHAYKLQHLQYINMIKFHIFWIHYWLPDTKRSKNTVFSEKIIFQTGGLINSHNCQILKFEISHQLIKYRCDSLTVNVWYSPFIFSVITTMKVIHLDILYNFIFL
jgi:hypothetical protein